MPNRRENYGSQPGKGRTHRDHRPKQPPKHKRGEVSKKAPAQSGRPSSTELASHLVTRTWEMMVQTIDPKKLRSYDNDEGVALIVAQYWPQFRAALNGAAKGANPYELVRQAFVLGREQAADAARTTQERAEQLSQAKEREPYRNTPRATFRPAVGRA